MALSIFTTLSHAMKRGDNHLGALSCYNDLADEVIVVDGGMTDVYFLKNGLAINSPWPREFKWPFIGQQFTKGYQACTGDFVLHMDLDFIFHEKDFGKIRQALKDYPTAPAISFYKWQFIQPDRYNLKSRLLLAVNKKVYGDRIKFDGGGESDLCQPSLDGKLIGLDETPQSGVAFWNYEHILKTKKQVKDDIGRMDRAYYRHYGRWLYSQDGTEESAFEGWCNMVKGRNAKPSKRIKLSEHPKYVQETIKNLRPEQFGYNGWGMFEVNDYAKN